MTPENAERTAETERISKACRRTMDELRSMKLEESMSMTDNAMIAKGVKHYLDIVKEENDLQG